MLACSLGKHTSLDNLQNINKCVFHSNHSPDTEINKDLFGSIQIVLNTQTKMIYLYLH